MARLNLKRATRHSVALSNGDELQVRALSALDFSNLVSKFEEETVDVASKIITSYQQNQNWNAVVGDPSIYADIVQALPDLICSAINLVAGGDDEDLEAIRELPIDDLMSVMVKVISISLERIGGLGNFLTLLEKVMSEASSALNSELLKKLGTDS